MATPLRPAPFRLLALVALPTLLGLSGCSMSRLTPDAPAASVTGMHGRVKGGQQPVSGATIQLYAVGSSGNGSGSLSLMNGAPVLTGADGSFNMTSTYMCPTAGTQVYLTSTQGNPGMTQGTNNAAITLVTALGSCGNLTPETFISVNEVTTVAAAYALAPFATSIANVGSSSTNSAGLANAMTNAMLLADSSTGASPAAGLPAHATVESDKLYTLANVLAACVNGDGTTVCPQLFSDTTYGGIPPTDTFGAVLAIAQHPDTYVHDIFTLTTPQAPFPASGNEPNEWTMTISYADASLSQPGAMAIDASNDIWVLNNGTGTLAGFTPQGAPLTGSPYTGDGTNQPTALAVDKTGNIWVTSPVATEDLLRSQPHPFLRTHPHAGGGGANAVGTITEYLVSGAEVTSTINYDHADLNGPDSVAVDPLSGNIWIANSGAQLSVLAAADGSEQVPGGGAGWGTTNGNITGADTVALDSSGNAYVVNGNAIGVVGVTSGTVLAYGASLQPQSPLSVAVDTGGQLWTGSGNGGLSSYLVALNASTLLQAGSDSSGGGIFNPNTLAVDSNDHVWVANTSGGHISEIGGVAAAEGSGTVLSPSTGLGLDALISTEPSSLAIDASGSLWVSDPFNNRLINFVGIAGPVKTPMLGAPVAP